MGVQDQDASKAGFSGSFPPGRNRLFSLYLHVAEREGGSVWSPFYKEINPIYESSTSQPVCTPPSALLPKTDIFAIFALEFQYIYFERTQTFSL